METRRVVTADDQLMAVWFSWIVFATIVVWTGAGGSGGPEPNGGMADASPLRYVIYTLPLTLGAAYWLSFGGARLRVDRRALAALAMYMALAATGMAANAWAEFYAIRDCVIVCSYLLLFVFWFRAPATSVDVCLAALLACLLVEAATRLRPGLTLIDADSLYAVIGLANPTGNNVFGPHGLLESTLGFPLGVLVLNYVWQRRWRMLLAAGLLQLVAFKRISFAGVAVSVAFDLLTRRSSFVRARHLAIAAAVGLSLLAMFSVVIFQWGADTLRLQNSSANAISLGRYDIAVMLWTRMGDAGPVQWLVGFGAGAADALSQQFSDLNPHNDWLKILFDYGIVGSLVIHAIFVLIFARNRLGMMIYLYTSVLMLTDNVFIYLYYYPFIALAMCAARK